MSGRGAVCRTGEGNRSKLGTPDSPPDSLADRSCFRILSLDGGGVQGAFTASFLAEIEEHADVQLVNYFDLIAGTSTGGIIALGLGLGLEARQITDFYREHAESIFGPVSSRRRRFVRRLIGPQPLDELSQALAEVFGDRTLGEAQTRLVIPSFNVIRGDIHLFKTAHKRRFKQDYNRTARAVALATSAAPTYFEPFTDDSGDRFVDGGIWANNPIAVAVNEAIGVLECRAASIQALSIGTTEAPFHLPETYETSGILGWLRDQKLSELASAAQQAGALGLARAILGSGDQLLRLNESIAPDRFELDDPTDVQELIVLGKQAARHAQPEVEERFLDEQVPPFKPHYQPERR